MNAMDEDWLDGEASHDWLEADVLEDLRWSAEAAPSSELPLTTSGGSMAIGRSLSISWGDWTPRNGVTWHDVTRRRAPDLFYQKMPVLYRIFIILPTQIQRQGFFNRLSLTLQRRVGSPERFRRHPLYIGHTIRPASVRLGDHIPARHINRVHRFEGGDRNVIAATSHMNAFFGNPVTAAKRLKVQVKVLNSPAQRTLKHSAREAVEHFHRWRERPLLQISRR